ncbi:MAG: glycosyltransferase [Synechococcaceae cyanobacterium]|nr:glycosyltransferase [Synechococcaceae cyanobacterium]
MADITLLATADWDHPLWTNKQHVALALARLGHRVLYIESLGLRGVRAEASDRHRILRRLRRGLRLPRRVAGDLWVWSPLVLPGARGPLMTALNRLLFAAGLALVRRWLGLRPDWLWTYNPRTLAYLDPGAYRRLIYHCVDAIQAQPGMDAADLDRWEEALCRRASVVFVTSPALETGLRRFNPRTHFFPNVADHAHFATALDASVVVPADLAALPHPRIGFIGAISAYKLDLALLEALAQARPDWSLVLIGPVGEGDPDTDVTALRRLANVHLLGARPYARLPAYLAGLDAAILPLRRNAYTEAMFPMKFFEYLAAGRPVVATAIRSLQAYGERVRLVPPEPLCFIEALEAELACDSAERRRERHAFASAHTYDRRTRSMLDLIAAL